MRRKLMLFVAVVAVILSASACDPGDAAQVQQWYDLNPTVGAAVTAETMNEPQRAVIQALQDRQTAFYMGIIAAESARSLDCYGAMERVFPASAHSWARGIISRESGGNPSAQNPGSSAAGCWQMLSMHDWRYYEVGCTPSQKYQALCNNKAALHLYQAAGTSPWRMY